MSRNNKYSSLVKILSVALVIWIIYCIYIYLLFISKQCMTRNNKYFVLVTMVSTLNSEVWKMIVLFSIHQVTPMDIYTRILTIFLEYSHFHNKSFIIISLILHSHKSIKGTVSLFWPRGPEVACFFGNHENIYYLLHWIILT